MYEDLKYWYLRDHKLFRTLSFGQSDNCVLLLVLKAQKGEIIYFSSSDLPRIFCLKRNIKIVAD
jgi:CRP/FNR family transcriptional regulator